MIYFDNASTTQLNSKALEDLCEKSKTLYGNPSSRYSLGLMSKKVLNEARKYIASVLSCNDENLFFTSGGTESNNIVLQSIIRNNSNKEIHIICSSIEHKSILKTLDNMKNKNTIITYVNPDSNGIIQPETILKAIRKNTILICVQYINNELGTIQPISKIAAIANKYNISMLVDAVQAVGHIDVNISKLGIDYLSASAHKFGGPKGVGFLYAKNNNICLCFGGGQEKGVKSGTENVPSISSMAVALKESLNDLNNKQKYITNLVNHLRTEMNKIKGLHFNTNNLEFSSIINFRIDGISNEALINYFDLKGICLSTGSACLGNEFERSYILKAIGLNDSQIDTSIRISLCSNNTIEECNLFLMYLNEGIKLLKR